jgi:hypothetical protein
MAIAILNVSIKHVNTMELIAMIDALGIALLVW